MLKLREQFPLTAGFLILEPTSAFVLPAGVWEGTVTITVSNTFTAQQDIERALTARSGRQPFDHETFERYAAADPLEQTFYLDAEITRTVFEIERGFGCGFELGLSVPVVELNGGFSDAVVEPFHDVLGFDQEGRSGVPHDQLALFVSGQGVELAIESGSGIELGDVEIGVRKRFGGAAASRALLVEVEVKLPTGEEARLVSSGGVDVGLGLVGSWCWSSRCAHAMAGVARLGASDRLGTREQSRFSAALGLEQALSRRWRLTVQGNYWQSYLAGIGFEHFAEDTVQLSLAATRRGERWGDLFFGLSENALSFKNSADVSFHLGWRRRFR